MRLYGMYFICNSCLSLVADMKLSNKAGANIKHVVGWQEKRRVLNRLASVHPIHKQVRKLYDSIPATQQDMDEFDIPQSVANEFIRARGELLASMETVIKMYESVKPIRENEIKTGFDISLPKFHDIEEFSKCLDDLNFVFKQCPYLNNQDAEIKYDSVDVGSTWVTFLIAGSSALMILKNLAQIVDMAVKIRSHVATEKVQEEALRSLEMKNDFLGEFHKTFKEVNNVITEKYVIQLRQELGELKDGEEIDKTKRSLEKLAYWMDKGLQIYSAIDAVPEARDLFPVQDDMISLSDDLQKLIEMRKEEK